MENKYEYLKKYINLEKKGNHNWFSSVSQNEIIQNEGELDVIFPKELKEFYQEVGYGFLIRPENADENFRSYLTNRINHPSMITEILKDGTDCGFVSQDVLDSLNPGDLPVFEIADGSSYMTMKLNSDNPNAVWYMGVEKIEDSFERFIWRLYHEAPDYYTKNW